MYVELLWLLSSGLTTLYYRRCSVPSCSGGGPGNVQIRSMLRSGSTFFSSFSFQVFCQGNVGLLWRRCLDWTLCVSQESFFSQHWVAPCVNTATVKQVECGWGEAMPAWTNSYSALRIRRCGMLGIGVCLVFLEKCFRNGHNLYMCSNRGKCDFNEPFATQSSPAQVMSQTPRSWASSRVRDPL